MRKILLILILLLFTQPTFANNLSCKVAMKAHKPIIALYTADYCTYCQRFKPIYKKVSKELSEKYSFVTIDVTQRINNGICDNVYIESIPTLYLFDIKTGKKQEIPRYLYTKNFLIDFLENYYTSSN